MIVADTDVLIDAMRGRKPSAARIRAELGAGTLATTAITAFELRSGAKSKTAAESVEALLEGVVILTLDERAANRRSGSAA